MATWSPIPDLKALTDALGGIAPTWRGRTDPSRPAQPTGFSSLNEVLPAGGWPIGALIEIIPTHDGIGEVSLTIPAIRQLCRNERRAIFIDPPFVPDPPALQGRGLPLQHTLWIATKGEEERIWAASQLLREKAIGAVLLWSNGGTERSLRRLQLAAESGQGLCFLFRGLSALKASSPAALRIELRPAAGSLHIQVHKARGGHPGSAVVRMPKVRI